LLVTLSNPTVARDAVYARTAVIAAEQRMRGLAGVRSQPPQAPRQGSGERERVAAALVKQKQQKLDRLRALLATGDVAKQDVEYAEAELAAAQRDLNAERERAAYERQAPTAAVQAGSPAMLQVELDRARADQVLTEHRQSLLTVKAPASGTIARLRVSQGSDVYTRDALADIVDAATARVQAPLAPELFRFVRVGMPVDVKLSTIPPRRFREPIARIVPPGGEGGAAVIVNIPNPDRMLQPGTAAIITIP
ncbi:MAG TPA: efflux RND transporter periplasmic adaptor subunit, partial [Thermoanaerobaculia bacterium]|nr:efflux RND transporter periplasmic adaptor subunit [Thermoanaerobaculia bacterium]